jgi:hypothetical protein
LLKPVEERLDQVTKLMADYYGGLTLLGARQGVVGGLQRKIAELRQQNPPTATDSVTR